MTTSSFSHSTPINCSSCTKPIDFSGKRFNAPLGCYLNIPPPVQCRVTSSHFFHWDCAHNTRRKLTCPLGCKLPDGSLYSSIFAKCATTASTNYTNNCLPSNFIATSPEKKSTSLQHQQANSLKNKDVATPLPLRHYTDPSSKSSQEELQPIAYCISLFLVIALSIAFILRLLTTVVEIANMAKMMFSSP